MWQELRTVLPDRGRSLAGERPPWMAKTVWAPFAMVLLGSGLWIKDWAKQPESAGSPEAVSDKEAARREELGLAIRKTPPRAGAPARFRLRMSYLGDFFLGWTFRHFITLSLMLSGTAIGVLAIGRTIGRVKFDRDSLHGQVRQTLARSHHEAGAAKQRLTGFPPSACATCVAALLGFRRK